MSTGALFLSALQILLKTGLTHEREQHNMCRNRQEKKVGNVMGKKSELKKFCIWFWRTLVTGLCIARCTGTDESCINFVVLTLYCCITEKKIDNFGFHARWKPSLECVSADENIKTFDNYNDLKNIFENWYTLFKIL